jgi:hypothetical protein
MAALPPVSEEFTKRLPKIEVHHTPQLANTQDIDL